jgi:hypothetical protein
MSLYYTPTGQLVEIDDDTYAMWVANGNPKADYYQPAPPRPHHTAQWTGSDWVMPSLDEFKAAKKTEIKTAARAQILARYPEWQQQNMTARAVELVSLGQTTGPEAQQIQAVWAWIKEVRARSDLLEADVDACTTVEAVEQLTIGGWPE